MIEEHLTRGERLFLLRRRAKKSFKDAAQEWEVDVETYLEWENDRSPAGSEFKLHGISQGEQYVIFRRRNGLTLRDVAEATGLSEATIGDIERDRGCHPKGLIILARFWS